MTNPVKNISVSDAAFKLMWQVIRMESLEEQLQTLSEENKNLRKALQFYAAKENWYPGDSFKQSCRIDENDLEYFSETQTSDLIGGKLARAVLENPTGQKIRRKRAE